MTSQAVIRVLSANLRSGKADARALVALVKKECIDVVCAQELSAGLADALAGVLPHGLVAHSGTWRGNGIAARRPVTVRRIPMARRDAFAATLAVADWPELASAVDIVNVHIAAPHTLPWWPNPVRRKAQLAALLADLESAADLPRAILGDLNSTPAWPVYRELAARYRDAAGDAGAVGTWPAQRIPWLQARFRIDHCFVAGVDVLALRTVPLPGSDHHGLLAELAVPPAGGPAQGPDRLSGD